MKGLISCDKCGRPVYDLSHQNMTGTLSGTACSFVDDLGLCGRADELCSTFGDATHTSYVNVGSMTLSNSSFYMLTGMGHFCTGCWRKIRDCDCGKVDKS
jgi:hypothetical protein